jgi:hypothetical protein
MVPEISDVLSVTVAVFVLNQIPQHSDPKLFSAFRGP